MNVISLLTPKAQVAYLPEDCTIRQGLEKLRAHSFTALPVVAKDGRYVGTVSEGDFLRCILDRKDNSLRTQEKLPLVTVMRQGFNPAVSIRVSMAELGCPLLGDGKYGRGDVNRRYGEKRQALYSYRLAFPFPTDAGALNYLRGRTFTVAEVPFRERYFPATGTNGKIPAKMR